MNLFAIGKNIIKGKRQAKLASFIFNAIAFNSFHGLSKNQLINNGAFLKHTKIKIQGMGNQLILSPKCYLNNCLIQIYGNGNKIYLDDQVVIHKGSFYIEDNGGAISIGQRTLVCGTAQFIAIEGRKIEIGSNCLFSSETVIRTGDSHSVLDKENRRINVSEDVIIEDHVWVGYRANILKGTHIKKNSVVSTGAIVTHKFDEAGIVIAGIPAKEVKSKINWSSERI